MAEAFGIACHQLVSLDFRFGSNPDSCDPPLLGLLLEVKRTKIPEKRTSPTDCPKLGVYRTYLGHVRKVRS